MQPRRESGDAEKGVFSASGKIHETFDLSNLDKGIYMIRLDNHTLSSGIVLQ